MKIKILEEVHAAIVERAEWWRIRPDDTHQIGKPVYVAMLEVANAINTVMQNQPFSRRISKKGKK